MSDRYRGYAPNGRASTFNTARTSLPTSIGYSSLYAGDMHVMPSSSSSSRQHTTPRGYWTTTTSGGVPTSTTRTYAVTGDPRSRHSTRDGSRARRSTLDSTSRPPVIITTTQKDRPVATSSSHSSNARAGSPVRNDYRSSEGLLYAQPSSSSRRSRSTVRPYDTKFDDEEYERLKQRGDALVAPRESELYRHSRPSVVYPSDPRHASTTVDYGDDGYQYTNAGELARYDLDHSKPGRSRHRDSFDRGYHRPNVNYNADQRSLNVNTSADLSRNYNSNTSRPYDGRGGPPTTTRGFDKINQAYEGSRDVPPAAPAPPAPAPASQFDGTAGSSERWEAKRSRPVSLLQETIPRSSHHDDYYRSRDDERAMRELRDRDRESTRTLDAPQFADDSVTSRGFGIRTGHIDDADERRDRRRDLRRDDPKKISDEDLARLSDTDRERRGQLDASEDRRGRQDGGEVAERDRSRFRDKVVTGLGIAATAVGLAPSAKDGEPREKDDREQRRRRSPEEDRERRNEVDDLVRYRAADVGRDRNRDRERDRDRDRERDRINSREEADLRERSRRETEARLNGEAVASASDSDEGRRMSRRNKPSNAFNPTDPVDLMQLKEELAAANTLDRGKERESLGPAEPRKSRSSSVVRESRAAEITKDDAHSRDLVTSGNQDKQVRLVSPPRDKQDEKPLKGILKHPSPSFPEEPNPVREGVAPHKEDKKVKEAPPGAKWTKISRKVVNPEALTIGKERFEVRDDFVIVLRVLSKEEIQAYASATQVLRERRRNGEDGDRSRDRGGDHDRDPDRDHDDDGGQRHRRHHHRDEEDEGVDERDRDRGRDRDRERRRRHRRDDE
ncbi:hypothetical protein S40285_05551 [Stachybotrys chlorohalonatus IBT 40285]|uniref:DUF8035 domain-containing protein n=1 Tax=Stachybotrys chlorohalonatus (strain IBT 40285) TaxID=1283841 RepID=A0A084QFG4_STAC4|nr:hypothetical protein S40285_05551 [Stachybotrys chlorohalonata IBT 40285]